MKVAIMQPYFYPYEGYFRLFSESDLFVVYDCVQFPRRGWVHRNKLINFNGELDWITLPIKKESQDVKIKDLQFQEGAKEEWLKRIAKFPALKNMQNNKELNELVVNLDCDVTEYLIRNLEYVCKKLAINFNIVRSSELAIDPELKGQDRIIAIAKKVGATTYINAPRGKELNLYNESAFQENNIALNFLDDYNGSYDSTLARMLKA